MSTFIYFAIFMCAAIGLLLILLSVRTALAVDTGSDHVLVAGGRAPDTAAIQEMADKIIAARQALQDDGED